MSEARQGRARGVVYAYAGSGHGCVHIHHAHTYECYIIR
jgi:hypothetical protein